MTNSADDVRFVLFGGVRIVRGGFEIDVTQPKQRALLALLLANAGEVLSVGSIIDALWTGEPAATAVNQLHRHVGALRRLCEPGLGRRQPGRYIIRIGRGYRIELTPDGCDVMRFRRFAARARELRNAGLHAETFALSLQALAIAASPPGDQDMADLPEFASLEDERVGAILAAADQCRNLTEYVAVLPSLRSAAERHPFDESLAASLIGALSSTGRGAEAVNLYRTVRRRLKAELGCEPGAALQRALADALRDDRPRPVDTGPDHGQATLSRPNELPMPLPGFVGRRPLTELRPVG